MGNLGVRLLHPRKVCARSLLLRVTEQRLLPVRSRRVGSVASLILVPLGIVKLVVVGNEAKLVLRRNCVILHKLDENL